MNWLFDSLLAAAPTVLAVGLAVTLIILFTGAGFQAFHGRFGWDMLRDRKRKRQGVILSAAILALLTAYLQTPLICFAIFPVFVLLWVVL
ncbi:MAG: hypothetical protein H6669_07410 [Ardenticatenaceae bacterium]|nr:hypothetical protein [Ardenticatenaceae bacterium]